jgi:hypothetical protein
MATVRAHGGANEEGTLVVSRGGCLRCCDLDSYRTGVRTKGSMGFWLVLFRRNAGRLFGLDDIRIL